MMQMSLKHNCSDHLLALRSEFSRPSLIIPPVLSVVPSWLVFIQSPSASSYQVMCNQKTDVDGVYFRLYGSIQPSNPHDSGELWELHLWRHAAAVLFVHFFVCLFDTSCLKGDFVWSAVFLPPRRFQAFSFWYCSYSWKPRGLTDSNKSKNLWFTAVSGIASLEPVLTSSQQQSSLT